MKKKKFMAPFYCFIFFTIVILVLFIQFCYLSLSENVYGINMHEFASNRNTVTKVLTANRGTIYDSIDNVLAQNITSYTLIAYLDSSRTKDLSNPKHVVDKEYTATKLASILGEENKEYILDRLNKKSKQVEFGIIGRNLTELTRIAIEELDLPGIDFTESVKRYYPNGNFASYIIGYSKQYVRINIKESDQYDITNYYGGYYDKYKNITIEIAKNNIAEINGTIITGLSVGNTLAIIKSNGNIIDTFMISVGEHDTYNRIDSTIVGELGIESKFETLLEGTDGYIEYQRDKYGYQIPDTKETRVDAINGEDIYLTIDSNIQRFTETAVAEVQEKYKSDWTIFAVMDAKDGSILASSTSPSYNPNNLPKDMSYQNPLVSYTYEPGSVMKIYSYMCAVETGKYNGTKKYLSGSYKVDSETTIHDWDKAGWGYLTYDVGFSYSSNIAVINIIKDYLSRKQLMDCLTKYGFGKKTGIELSNEESGVLKFTYDSEIFSAGFGQGITTTAIQQLQALSIVANDGVMVKPYIIKKTVNPNTKEEKVTKVEKSEKLVSSSTISKMKDLMESVINPSSPTGKKYYLEGYGLIGKTGTAQIASRGKYLGGYNDYIASIGIMYPKDDPQIIIYAATKRPINLSDALPAATKELVKNINKYRGILNGNDNAIVDTSIKVNNYISKNTLDVQKELNNIGLKPILIGNGKNIINQYPTKNSTLLKGDRVFLVTNNNNYTMPNISKWSRNDVSKLCELIGMKCSYEGYGYVASQSIKSGSKIDTNSELKVLLGNLKVDE